MYRSASSRAPCALLPARASVPPYLPHAFFFPPGVCLPQRAPRLRLSPRLRSAAAETPTASHKPASWQPCLERLCTLGLGPDEADLALRKAHAWGFHGYWRQSKSDEAPDAAKLDARLAFLRERCGGDDEALRQLVLSFPEAVGLDLEQLEKNVGLLAKSYGIGDGPALQGVLKRKPQVLGNLDDCSGDCAGFCNRCWARF
jgi:hypothetical protein